MGTQTTATQTPEPRTTQTVARGGLLVASPTTPPANATVIEYDRTRFGAVPSLNQSVTAAAASGDTVTTDLSPAERDAVEEFLASACETDGDCIVSVDGVAVEVSVAVEA